VRNPQKNFCTDNGAMIAAAGFFIGKIENPILLQADPNLSL
jgi:tRNA A37 threonylcarbamoyltransferase TsaD